MNALNLAIDMSQAVRLPSNSAPTSRVRTARKRALVYRSGDRAADIYTLLEGRLILWQMLPDGRRQIVQIVGPGQAFGFAADDLNQETAEAISDIRFTALPLGETRDNFVEQARYLRLALQRIRDLQAHAVLLGRMSALERVATFLNAVVTQGAEQNASNATATAVEFRLSVTREEIGDYLGMTIETVSRCLGKLRRAGIIQVKQPDFVRILDGQTLRSMAVQADLAMMS